MAGGWAILLSLSNVAPASAAERNAAGVSLAIIAPSTDWGDAPEAYPVKSASGGASQRMLKGFSLGQSIDAEFDGQPSTDALGDGTDEDGVQFLTPLVPGATATVRVTLEAGAVSPQRGALEAWIDFNADFDWDDTGERIIETTIVQGANDLSFTVPTAAKTGVTFARFRLSQEGKKGPRGQSAEAGEIEDYRVQIVQQEEERDFGDAPQTPYPTKLPEGAWHRIVKGFHLGATIDSERDGQPDATATGDDLAPAGAVGDEDGVLFAGALVIGQGAAIEVIASARGLLDAWFDFNADGDWDDSGEYVFIRTTLNAGSNPLTFTVPPGSIAQPGVTFARFRFSHNGVESYRGPAADGEVEDYLIELERLEQKLDFGDAPDSYRTTLKQDGPRHAITERIFLGARVDAESDGQPTATSLGDDLNPPGVADDEDGVSFAGPLTPGGLAKVEVVASISGRLDAWVDFNGNGTFADGGERVYTNEPIGGGLSTLEFPVPTEAKLGDTYSRWRFSREGVKDFFGPAQDGEVEDHIVTLAALALDFGDAPEFDNGGYPTTLARNGARHRPIEGFLLGKLEDVEPDGQPSADASGDDLNPPRLDDEDGVRFLSPLVPGSRAQVEIVAPGGGRLDAWIDFGQDFSWAQPEDRIFAAQPLPSGTVVLTFDVPTAAKEGRTFSRFRLNRKGGLSFDGPASDGEVEDHPVDIERRQPCDLTCTGTEFWLAFPGNYAPDPANPVKPQLCVVGTAGTAVHVEVAELGLVINQNIPAAGFLNLALPKEVDLGNANDIITKKGIHLTASNPVSVHALSQVKFTSDGYLGLASDVLGRAYVVLSQRNAHAAVPELNGSQFVVVGTQPDTRVAIAPSVVTGVRDAKIPYLITLQPGEAYQLRTTSGAPADLTGTLIASDKPIAVFGSHQCANVKSSDFFFCDYLVEQLPPVGRWGKEYYTRPLATRTKGDVVRVVAAYDNTGVLINGVPQAVLNQGQIYETTLTAASQILCTQPALVAQYAASSDFDLVTNADPFMTLVPPRPLFNSNYRFCVPASGFATHHLNLIVPNGAIGSLQLDGAPLALGFLPIGASGFSHATTTVAPGLHTLTAAQPIGLNLYGWNQYESYGWPVCFFFGDTTPPELYCPTEDIHVVAGSPGTIAANLPCRAVVPDLREQVDFTDNCRLSDNARVQQDPPPGTVVGVGTHPITLSVSDAAGNVGTCVVNFVVEDPSTSQELRIDCPEDIRVVCDSRQGAVVHFDVRAYRGCTPLEPVVCEPPSGTLFPRGVTRVLCRYVDPTDPAKTLDCAFDVVVGCNRLTITHVDQTTAVEWTAGGVLETATDPGGPWQAVTAAQSPFRIQPTDRHRFYRVREEP